MNLRELIVWAAVAVLAFFGGWAIIANYAVVVLWYVKRKHGSMVPLFGGLLFAAAMFICPVPEVRRFFWIPFLIDLGCIYSLPGFLYSVFVLKCFKK
jgi:hypothetical protein